MPLICLEGASAVGKTTTARWLAEHHGAAVVPEVNALFARPVPEPAAWYLERQAERWRRARQLLATHPLVLLDGDALQPAWYDWIYRPTDYPTRVRELHKFYRQQAQQGTLALPDAYVLLTTNEPELRRRKAHDTTRSRRNFEQHLRLIEPQRCYFTALARLMPGRVHVVAERHVAQTVAEVLRIAAETEPLGPTQAGPLLDELFAWLSQNQPN